MSHQSATRHYPDTSSACQTLTQEEAALADHLDAHIEGLCPRGVADLAACESETPGLLGLLAVAEAISIMSALELREVRITRDELLTRIRETSQDVA